MRNTFGLDIKKEWNVAKREAEDFITFRNVYIKTVYD